MWSRDEDLHAVVPVELGLGAHFRWFGRASSIPTATVRDDAVARTLEIAAPGARSSNTEVCWDESSRRLLVGVWCGRRPNLCEPLKLPVPELFWFRSFHLPNHDGSRSRVRLGGGLIEIEVPAEAPGQSTQPQMAPATKEQDLRPIDNVIPLPTRREPTGSERESAAENLSSRSVRLAVPCQRLGTAISFALCLPVLLFSLLLLGFVLVPLLPLIGAGLALSLGRGVVPPPLRPNRPAAARRAPAIEQAQAA